jgi:aminoglycoside phosphotransferase (APT) family kinase protein
MEDPKQLRGDVAGPSREARAIFDPKAIVDASFDGAEPRSAPTADAKLPFLETAWSREGMTRFLNERILPELTPGHVAGEAQIARMIYSPGKQCVMWYSLSWRPIPGVSSPALDSILVSVFERAKLEKIRRRHPPASGPVADEASPSGRALFVPEAGALVETFPLDRRLPALMLATDMRYMAPLLERADAIRRRAVAGAEAPAGNWRFERLRYHPNGRCVLLYTTDADGTDAAPRSMIGKLYRKSQKAENLWRILQLLSSERSGGCWRSAQPLLHLGDLNLILMECLRGVSLKSMLIANESSRDVERGILAVARVLKALHQLSASELPTRTVESDRIEIWEKLQKVHAVSPETSDQLGRLLSTLEERSSDTSVPATSVIHGNSSPSHFSIDRGSVSILDLDGVSAGDPAIDVGTFLACLGNYAAKSGDGGGGWRAAEELFLMEYLKGASDRDLGHRARVVQCQELVSYAARSYLKKVPGSDQSRATPYLAEAARCLRGL